VEYLLLARPSVLQRMAGTHMTSAAGLYQSVINDVITSVRESFLDESVDENVLLELKNLWVQKLEASKAIEQPQMTSDAAALDSKMAGARGGYGGRPAGGTNHVVINDPNRLVPVQITIPAQQGNPTSQPRALTVQVPAHALQQGGTSGSTLQQVLTQAITQALSLPPDHAAVYLQSQINQAFRLG